MSRRRLALRTRAMVGLGTTGLVVALVFASAAFALSRAYLIDQREEVAQQQTFVNARLARTVLRAPRPDVRAFLGGLGGGTASTALVRHRGEWFSTSVDTGPDDIPADLLRVIADGDAGHQRYRDAAGDLHVAVAVPIAAADAVYVERFSLIELDRTLGVLARSLAVASLAAAVAAAGLGRILAGRLVRPLHPVADAAERIAAGALDTRITESPDPDLRRLVEAFNTMASALETRVEREARFAADVSHELRTPLAAVSAAVEIIGRRRDQLPDEVLEAFIVLSGKIETFQAIVLDLLEISRLDAGTVDMGHEQVDIADLAARLAGQHGTVDIDVRSNGAGTLVVGDRRRLAQVFTNILANADRYAGGVRRITVDTEGRWVRVALEDDGPGVPAEERDAIFGRFARGTAGLHAGTSSGTGLGLALVAEHVRLHGGRVWVEEGATGGARFVIELPCAAASAESRSW